MGLKLLYNGQVTDFSDSKYDPKNYGSMRLNVRAGGEIKKYGLATSAEQVSDKRLRFKINNNTYYIGTSEARSRQSNHTSYSTYYTYTYTSPEQRSSVLTRQGTTTTTYKTYSNPGYSIYHITYCTATRATYTYSNSRTLQAYELKLSSERTFKTTDHYSGSYSYWVTPGSSTKVSVSHVATKSNQYFKTGGTKYTSSSFTRVAGTYRTSYSTTRTSSVLDNKTYITLLTSNGVSSTPKMYTHTSITSRTVTANINWSTSHYRSYSRKITVPVVKTMTDFSYAVHPNYLSAKDAGRSYDTYTYAFTYVYPVSLSVITSTGNHVPNQYYYSYITSISYNLINQSNEYLGSGTFSSTDLRYNGIPSNYIIMSTKLNGAVGGGVVNYTDSDCTATYVSNYSTSYYTVTRTLTSNQPTKTSVGSTLTTRVSHYTDHNFV